jgi:hypothetical protein
MSPTISIFSAICTGDLHLGGTLAQPVFGGDLTAYHVELNSPGYISEHLYSEEVQVYAEENRLTTGTMYLTTKKGSLLLAELEIIFARWALEELTLSLKTPPAVFVPLKMQVSRIGVNAEVHADMQIQLTGDAVTVTGNATAQNGEIRIESVLSENIERLNPVTQLTNLFTAGRLNSAGAGPPDANRGGTVEVVTDLTVTAGNRVQVMVNPILRGLIAPGTPVGIRVNTLENDYEITGDIVLRGGEVQWFNRNFYLREGRVVFTETDAFDPRLTIRAEVRERDVDGGPLLLIIQAENQRLSEFAPTYTAIPAKSETEIMALLGQNFIADLDTENPISAASGLSLVGTTGDLLLQLNLMRRIENSLRELLKVDILSMRATWLQNVLASNPDANDTRRNSSLGSVLNNSTLYVGKYFADELYVDAMLHFLYDESRAIADPDSTGMIFQPELGLEINAPFATTLRWSFAPEIYSWDSLLSPSAWVPATSITLSRRWDGEEVWQFFKELF